MSDSFAIGQRVTCSGGQGTVRFDGTTSFAPGRWVGVELDEPRGKNDGSVLDVRYFTCRPSFGLFLRPSQVHPDAATAATSSSSSSSTRPASRASGRPTSTMSPAAAPSASGSSTPRSSSSTSAASKRVSLMTAASQAAAAAAAPARPPSRPVTPSSASPTLDRAQSAGSLDGSGGRTTPPSMSQESAAALRNLVAARGGGSAGASDTKPASRRSSTMAAVSSTTPPSLPRSLSGSAESLPARGGGGGSGSQTSLPGSRRSSTLMSTSRTPPPTTSMQPNAHPMPAAAPSMRPNDAPMPTTPPLAAPRPVVDVDADADTSLVESDNDQVHGNATDLLDITRDDLPVLVRADRPAHPHPHATPDQLASVAVHDEQGTPQHVTTLDPSMVRGALHHQASLVSLRQQQQQQQPPVSPSPSPGTLVAATTTPTSPPGTYPPAPVISAKDYDVLRAKVRHLESQRVQDAATIRDLEALAASAKDAVAGHAALQDKLTAAVQEVRELKRHARALEAQVDAGEAKVQELSDMLEIVTMEKEFAEEQVEVEVEQAKAKCDEYKAQVEELKMELELLEEEKALGWGHGMAGHVGEDEGAEPGGDAAAAVAAAQVRDLRIQVARLKDALGVLKDEYDALQSRALAETQVLKVEAAQGAEAKTQLAGLRARLAEAQEANAQLQDQVDELRASEELVEKLAFKIVDLEKDVDDMRSYIAELEALKDVADEMELAHQENEKDLLKNLEHRDVFIQGLELSLAKVENVMADYERTIALFREKVAALARENEELRAVALGAQGAAGSRALARAQGDTSLLLSPGGGASGGSEQQEVLALHHKLQTHAMKVQTKTIDLELKQLEAQQAGQHLALVQAYLPQAFFATEQEPIAALLLVRRLMFKADMLLRHGGHTRPSASGSSGTEDLDAEAARMDLTHELGWMRRTAAALAAYMETCPADVFGTAVARTQPELVSAEKRLDAAVAQVKTDGALRAHAVAPELARLNRQLDVTLHQLTSGATAGTRSHVYRLAQLVQVYGAEDAAARAALAVQRVAKAQVPGGPLDGVAEGMAMNLGQVRASSRKLARTLEEAKGALVADGQSVAGLLGSMQTVAKYFAELSAAVVDAGDKVSTAADVAIVLEDLALRHFDRTETRPLTHVVDAIKRTAMDVAVLYESTSAQAAAESADTSSTVTEPAAPWVARAEQLRVLRSADPAAQKVVADAQSRLARAVQELRSKDEEVRELTVRCQLLESRSLARESQAAVSSTTTAQVDELTRAVDKYKTELADMNQFVDHLRAEALELETRNRDLERKLNEAKLNTPVGGSAGASAPGTPAMGSLAGSAVASAMASPARARGLGAAGNTGAASASSPELLVAAITHLRAENARLKAAKLMQQLDACPLPPLPLVSLHDLTTAPTADDAQADGIESTAQPTHPVAGVHQEARSLLRQARELASSPRVVRVPDTTSARRTAQGWMPMEKRPGMQLQRDRIEARMLARKAMQLQASLATLGSPASATASRAAPAFGARGPVRSSHSRRLSGSSVMSFMTNLTGVDRTPKVATFKVPKVKGIAFGPEDVGAGVVSQGGVVNCYVNTPAELERLHNVFVT